MKFIFKLDLISWIIIFLAPLFLYSCYVSHSRKNYKSVNEFVHAPENVHSKAFLKAHHRNGNIYILRDTWKFDSIKNTMSGQGSLYNLNRSLLFNGELEIPIDSISIFETNTKIQNPESARIAGITVLAALDVVIGLVCLSNPKACFGSCPTFYINENDNFHFANAESFSNAIAPAMEYNDIDALYHSEEIIDSFMLTMKNEALETHCINELKLLAFQINERERVLHSPDDKFYLSDSTYFLSSALAQEGDVLQLLNRNDRNERFSWADEKKLNSKENIFLTFENVEVGEELGLSVRFRQSLMTTYFIYSAIGYMGDKMSDIFAEIENGRNMSLEIKDGLKKELGKIDIYFLNENSEWIYCGGFYETGPIAINYQMIKLNQVSKNDKVEIKIVLNKGLWRLDNIELVNVKKELEPMVILPSSVKNKGKEADILLDKLKKDKDYLISMPGDEFLFKFDLPIPQKYDLFLSAGGYYLEWMREQWLKDKNLIKLNQLVNKPEKYLKKEVANYKKYEAGMEEQFWNSKVDTKNFSYYEK